MNKKKYRPMRTYESTRVRAEKLAKILSVEAKRKVPMSEAVDIALIESLWSREEQAANCNGNHNSWL